MLIGSTLALGNSNGTFQLRDLQLPGDVIAVGDLDGDGYPDIVTKEYASDPNDPYSGGNTQKWKYWYCLNRSAPDVFVGTTIDRMQGSRPATFTLATVSDGQDVPGALAVTLGSVPASLTITNLTNTNGTVTATIEVGCSAITGANPVELQVRNSSGVTITAIITVNVTANSPPQLGHYPSTAVRTGSSAVVKPSAAPTDNGSVAQLTVGARGFPGALTIDRDTGDVYVGNVALPGNYAVTVSAVDDCGVTAWSSFQLIVMGARAGDQYLATPEDTPLSITLTYVGLPAPTAYVICEKPLLGVLQCSGPDCVYTPTQNVNGQDSFTYDVQRPGASQCQLPATVTVAVDPVNDRPDAADDLTSVKALSDATFNVLSNDSDVDGDSLTLLSHTKPAHGVVNCSSTGECSYRSTSLLANNDHFDYTVSDSHGTTASGTVVVNIERNRATVPVVGSFTGATGSPFRTALLIYNMTSAPMQGILVFQPEGVNRQPSIHPYSLDAGAGQDYEDVVVELGTSGIGSFDLISADPLPVAMVRICSGMTSAVEDVLRPDQLIRSGDEVVLIAPADPARWRFNIGVRTFDQVAAIAVSVVDEGRPVGQIDHSYDASTFVQSGASEFAGGDLAPNAVLRLRIVAGEALVYGAATDSGNNVLFQDAQPVEQTSETAILPVVGSLISSRGRFSTAIQLHNPFPSASQGKILFHPQGSPAGDNDPSFSYVLAPDGTLFVEDLIGSMGRSGVGAADVVTLSGNAPIAAVQIRSDTGGAMIPAMRLSDVLRAGARSVLFSPVDAKADRFNIGVRTFDEAAVVSIVTRGFDGHELGRITRFYEARSFEQVSATDLLGYSLTGGEVIEIAIDRGSALIYGVATNNVSNGLAVQIAR
ncbi:MAG TPA: Ig-like domain-containing protein [Thermoanaerobaculia bacterium]|nr:Ig-like domain-containing protein [Thermoanaerobaculia bacterium]